MTAYTGDRILVAIFGGILNGVGLEMIFMRGGSTGGTDIVALNLHKHFPYFSTGNLIFAADALVLIMVFFVYNSIESVLYAVVTIFSVLKLLTPFHTVLREITVNLCLLLQINTQKFAV